MENTAWLAEWYIKNCNGDWEHQYGVKIETLDNPGWHVEIDLIGTRYGSILYCQIIDEKPGESDWIVCKIVDGRFHGYGDALKLGPIIQRFRSWVDGW